MKGADDPDSFRGADGTGELVGKGDSDEADWGDAVSAALSAPTPLDLKFRMKEDSPFSFGRIGSSAGVAGGGGDTDLPPPKRDFNFPITPVFSGVGSGGLPALGGIGGMSDMTGSPGI